jgi:DNA end-binding protein Ku
MARSIWSGSLTFGLVNVPISLYSATQDKTVHFNQLERGTSSRIRYRRVNEDTGEEVDYANIVKGHDVGGGQYVVVTREELEEIEPGRSRTIDISDFVDAADIDPIYYQKTYYLGPQSDQADRAYALLRQAMMKAGKVAIATFVMRTKQYLAAIRPDADVLVLETMFFADEVRNPVQEIEQLPTGVDLNNRDLDMAVQLIESMATAWDATVYRDTYRDRLSDLIDAKRKGREVVTEQPTATSDNVVDLMEALRASVEAAKNHQRGNGKQASKLQTRPSSAGAAAQDNLADMTKKELYQLAQDLDVPGRSSMRRDELEQAVRPAQNDQDPKKKAS